MELMKDSTKRHPRIKQINTLMSNCDMQRRSGLFTG